MSQQTFSVFPNNQVWFDELLVSCVWNVEGSGNTEHTLLFMIPVGMIQTRKHIFYLVHARVAHARKATTRKCHEVSCAADAQHTVAASTFCAFTAAAGCAILKVAGQCCKSGEYSNVEVLVPECIESSRSGGVVLVPFFVVVLSERCGILSDVLDFDSGF